MEKKRVLLVEDNADDVELALLALEEHYGNRSSVTVLRDGQQAVDYLETIDGALEEGPSVVLLDLKLPWLDGFEVLRRIRANPVTRFVPVVVLSSSNEESDMRSSYELGANSFIQKSLDFSKFSDSVRQIGHYWLELNSVPRECRKT